MYVYWTYYSESMAGLREGGGKLACTVVIDIYAVVNADCGASVIAQDIDRSSSAVQVIPKAVLPLRSPVAHVCPSLC